MPALLAARTPGETHPRIGGLAHRREIQIGIVDAVERVGEHRQ
ncbi:hypothetical protein P3T21_007515, partial [Paraburkholderia sp. GAS334]